jgi:hypothetical protein
MILFFLIMLVAGFSLFGWWMILIVGALAILYGECYVPWDIKRHRKDELKFIRDLNKQIRREQKFSACHLYMAAYNKKTKKQGN